MIHRLNIECILDIQHRTYINYRFTFTLSLSYLAVISKRLLLVQRYNRHNKDTGIEIQECGDNKS